MDTPERQTLGRYELIERLGRGGATEAFRAKSFGVEGFEKTIVVKRLLPDVAGDDAFVQAFLEHVQRAMRLSHANLSQIFDLGRAGERPTSYFFATEYVSGIDLGTLVERARAAGDDLPLPLAVYVALEVAKAVDHAHRRRDEELRPLRIVHGAVAPHAVLVSFEGDVKLTDFGMARAVLSLPRQRESLRRNFAALAPEQAAGAEPSVASDVFSLGSLFYGLVTGRAPFLGETAEETLRSVVRARPAPLGEARGDVPGPIAELVHRAMSVDPEERFPSASAFHEELLACSYACGVRSSAGELAAFVERYREPPPTVPSEVIDDLLSRPLTVPPPATAPDTVPDEAPPARATSVPPLTGFGEMRHVSVLAFAPGGAEVPQLQRRVAAIVERYGGQVAELGAETTVLFGLDRSDGRDLERAVRCGLVLARTFDVGAARAGVGIDAGRLRVGRDGEPVRDERTTALVDSAHALAAHRERAVLVSRRAAGSLRGRFPLEMVQQGFRVTEFAQDRFTDSFVGRRDALRALGETLVRAARGELRTIRIQGEPGIGKTRLAVEMQRRLGRGSVELATYFATCPPRGRELPDSGIVSMLRRVCGVRDGDPSERIEALAPRLRALGMSIDETVAVLTELGRAVPQGRVPANANLKSAFIRLLQGLSEDRFTVFVWDDAHELDAASCDVLARAATRLAGSRLAIVLSGRRDPGAPYEALEADVQIPLGELEADDVETLIAERAGIDEVPPELVRFLRDRAGGQPLFVEELLRQVGDTRKLVVNERRVVSLALDEGVKLPRTLRALTSDRIRLLDDDERHLFVAAAVLEPPVDMDVLARMVELPYGAVEQVVASLAAQGLLGREGGGRIGFPMPLAREVVLEELDPRDLEGLHRRAAAAVESGLREQGLSAFDEVGYHLAAAGDRDQAAEHYARSGLSYLAERKLDRAAQSLVYALDLARIEARSAEQIGNWLGALSTAVRYVRGSPGLAELVGRLAHRVEAEERDPVRRARMRIDIAAIQGALGNELAGEALLDAGADEARTRPELATALLSTYAELASGRGDFRAARRALDPLSRLTLTDRNELHRTTLAMARTLAGAGKHAAAAAALQDAVRVASPEDPLLSLDRAAVRTALRAAAGEFRAAAESAVQAAAQAEELGLLHEVASSLSEQAVALTQLGDAARARAAVASALAAADEIAAERVALRCRLLVAYLEGAAPEEMRGDVAHLESRGWIADALVGRHLLGLLAFRLGDRETGTHELTLASRIAAKVGNQAMADRCDAALAGFS